LESKAPLERTLPTACEGLATAVPLPSVTKGDDMRAVAARHRAALVQANRRLDSSRKCNTQVRTDYRGGK